MPKITSNVFFLKEKRFDAENGINSGESRQKKTHFEVHITTNRPLEMKWRSEQWTSWQGDNIKTKRSGGEGDKKVSSIDWFVVPSSTIRACAHTSVCELRVSCIGNTLRCRFWHQVVFYTRNALDAVFGIRLFFKCCVRRVKIDTRIDNFKKIFNIKMSTNPLFLALHIHDLKFFPER